MALDTTAATAAATAYVNTLSMDPATKALVIANLAPLIAAIYAGIVANAVVDPAGTPSAMAAGGDNVTGTGRVT